MATWPQCRRRAAGRPVGRHGAQAACARSGRPAATGASCKRFGRAWHAFATPEAARYVREKVWHPTQRLQEEEDGGLVVTLEVKHLLEVKRWGLSYGAGCEVLEPEELRRDVSAELHRTLEAYDV
ncbi:MAG TPA: WYL domain-containing protein [Gemmataceae bacterium]|jgi:predicted DNA-binding transcriptional regulator YafY|nr:WYL domain-containing protein [Gemmataceae bacterium]